jgi:hypothetical protein
MIGEAWTGSATGTGAESPALPLVSNARTTTSTAINKTNVENFILIPQSIGGATGYVRGYCNPAARRDRSPLHQILELIGVKRNNQLIEPVYLFLCLLRPITQKLDVVPIAFFRVAPFAAYDEVF